MSPYQAVGGVSESYLSNGYISVHMTLPTRKYSSQPPLQRTLVLEGQFSLHSELVHVLPQALGEVTVAACVIVV